MSFQSRVENWQRWARGHAGLRPIQAESLERLYRSLNWGDLADGPPTALEALRGAVDVLDAQVIEDAWRTLPEPYKGFLKGAWIKAEHHRKTCRLNGVHWRQYDEILMLAMLMLREVVEEASSALLDADKRLGTGAESNRPEVCPSQQTCN